MDFAWPVKMGPVMKVHPVRVAVGETTRFRCAHVGIRAGSRMGRAQSVAGRFTRKVSRHSVHQ
jgi:hypothetical protein